MHMGVIRPFRLGVVGHAADKFTRETEARARLEITRLITDIYCPDVVVSGGCHLGGIDVWSIEIAERLGIRTEVHLPANKSWSNGYRERNLTIATRSTVVVCVVVSEYPPDYRGQRFGQCYHCRGRNPSHVKSGGCWTAWRCKRHEWVII